MLKEVFRRILKPIIRYRLGLTARYIGLNAAKRHVYISGRTGSGKTSLIEQWIYHNWYKTRSKESLSQVIIDPHGDMAEVIRSFDLAKKYKNRLVYLDPFLSKKHNRSINPLEIQDKSVNSVELYAQQLLNVFEELIPEAKLSNYMKAILMPCLCTLMFEGGCNLKDLQAFLSSDHSRNEKRIGLGKKSKIESHRQFFEHHFNSGIYEMTKTSILTKIQSLLNTSSMNQILNNKTTVDLEELTDQGKIIVFNLSKGSLGEMNASILGAFIIARLKHIALSRARKEKQCRKPIYLIVDEADSFIGGNSMNVILKEARKYGLHLFLITQNLIGKSKDGELRKNVLSNTNVKVIGSNSVDSLKPLSTETNILLAELVHLKSYEFIIKTTDKNYHKIRLKNLLDQSSVLRCSKKDKKQQTEYLLEASGYYKREELNISKQVKSQTNNEDQALLRPKYG